MPRKDPSEDVASPTDILRDYIGYLSGKIGDDQAAGVQEGVGLIARSGGLDSAIAGLSSSERDTLYQNHPELRTQAGGDQGGDQLGDILAALRSAAAGPRQESQDAADLRRNIDLGDLDFGGRIETGGGGTGGPESSTVSVNEQTVENINRRVRRYVDVPTPEEFLNEFQNSFATHIKDLMGGGVNVPALQWAVDNMEMFLVRYLGDLGERARRGENIFKVVGATGEPKFEGTRAGASESATSTRTGTRVTEETTTGGRPKLNLAGSKAPVDRFTAEMAARSQGASPAQIRQAGDAADAARSRYASEVGKIIRNQPRGGGGGVSRTTTNINETQTVNEQETEDVFSRPHLTTVFARSPLDYLGGALSKEALLVAYEGQRGTRARQSQAGFGTVGTRRVV